MGSSSCPELFHSSLGSAIQGQPWHHLLLVPAPGRIFLLSIGFCTFSAPCLWMGSHLCLQMTWGAELWPVLRGYFDVFPIEEGRASCTRPAEPWRPHRPGAASPAQPGRVCSPAGLEGFPAHIPRVCEVWLSTGFGEASWGSHMWSHAGSHP